MSAREAGLGARAPSVLAEPRREEAGAGRPSPASGHTRLAKRLWEWRAGPAQSGAWAGRAADGQRQPGARRASAKLAKAPPLAALAPLGPCGRPVSVQTLGPRAEGGWEGGHCCGFAAKEGTYLGYLGDRQGSGPAAPRLCLPALTTGTCHLRNVFIFSQSLARFPPHSLRAGRGAGRRGKVKVRAGSKEGWKRVPNSALCKENTMGPANSACHSVRHHPTGLPKPPPTTPQEVTFHPGPWPAEGTRGTRGPKCRVGSIRLAERGTLSPRTPVKG